MVIVRLQMDCYFARKEPVALRALVVCCIVISIIHHPYLNLVDFYLN